MFCKKKNKDVELHKLVIGNFTTGKIHMLLEHVLKGIRENCTTSIVDMTHSEPKTLCCEVKGYESKKMYEVISMEKCNINGHIDYFIRVIEIRSNQW